MTLRIGIHALALATGSYVVHLDDIAERAGVDPAKYHIGLGQDEMSVLGPDEDIVTMGASAAARILADHGMDNIRTLLFATESGIDQSRAAGVYVHELLGLPRSCRVVEMKQACYAGAAALQTAAGLVARDPSSQVLVIASDVARYDLDSAAEPTQGAGAVAFLVSADPALAELEDVTGVYTAEVDDFWRPIDSVTAVVNGKLSVTAYLDAFTGAWDDYRARGGVDISAIDAWCHHQPFTKMARKAQQALVAHTGHPLSDAALDVTTTYNRRIGNSYTASLFLAFAALIDSDEDLTGKRVGMFSYGSGSVSELFTLRIVDTYRAATDASAHRALLDARDRVDVATYRELHAGAHRDSWIDDDIAPDSPGPFHFAGTHERARRYTRGS